MVEPIIAACSVIALLAIFLLLLDFYIHGLRCKQCKEEKDEP